MTSTINASGNIQHTQSRQLSANPKSSPTYPHNDRYEIALNKPTHNVNEQLHYQQTTHPLLSIQKPSNPPLPFPPNTTPSKFSFKPTTKNSQQQCRPTPAPAPSAHAPSSQSHYLHATPPSLHPQTQPQLNLHHSSPHPRKWIPTTPPSRSRRAAMSLGGRV